MIWLASYPRSGNTWLRFLLSSYFLGTVQDSQEMEDRIPNLQRGDIGHAWAHDPALGKAHRLWNEHHPHRQETRGCVYLIRHPKDVLLSNLNYFKLHKELAGERAFVLDFIRCGGAPAWRTDSGSWEEHARSWIEDFSPPRLVIRYEAMKADPHAALTRVVRFLGLEPEPERIERAVRDCELSRLRRLEVRERRARSGILFRGGFEELDPSLFFFHQGGVGNDLSPLGEDLDELFDRSFGGSLHWLDAAEPR
jgi:aryl sulfotransferase